MGDMADRPEDKDEGVHQYFIALIESRKLTPLVDSPEANDCERTMWKK
jgi:hypothetical protein